MARSENGSASIDPFVCDRSEILTSENAGTTDAISHASSSSSGSPTTTSKLLTHTEDSPLSDLGIDDYKSLVRLSTARMGCFNIAIPIPVSLPSEEFVSRIFTQDNLLVEGSESFVESASFATVEEAIGKPLSFFFPPHRGYGELFAHWHRRNLSRGSFEVSVLTESGSAQVLQVVAYATLQLNAVHRIWFIIRDVTAQAKTVATLAHAERHYRSLVERPGLVLGRILLNETAEYFSPSLQEMLGVEMDQLKDSPSTLTQFVHPEDLAKFQRLYVSRSSTTLETIDTELRIRLKDGDYHAFYVRQSPMVSPRGSVEFYDFIAIDIQRHKELEQELQRNAQVALVGQLAAGISHDFNNYLSAILGQLDAAITHLPTQGPACDAVGAARKGAQACAQMATQLLNIGKGRSNAPKEVDLNEVVHEVCTLVSRVIPNRITLRVSTYPKPIFTLGERVQLQQVIINLILNARDAMPQGGVLSVQVNSATPRPQGTAVTDGGTSISRNAVAACIAVRDTGSGMSSETLNRIFRPFYTTKSKSGGTGLGLSMVKMIIEAHQGWLDVVSEEGEGTTFTVYLPLIHREALIKKATINPTIQGPPTLAPRTIAIAEDDDMIRSMLSTALTSMGCIVEVFPNGILLVEHLRNRGNICEFIILDDSMPKARGVELLESIRELRPDADMILTSGDPAVSQDPALRKFNVRFLAKPFPLADLIALLE